MRETTRMMLLGLTGSLAMTSMSMADKGDAHFVVENLFGTGTNDVSPAPAGVDLVIDVAGIESWDPQGDPDNIVNTYNIGANAHVTGLAWDVTLQTTMDPSWLSEISVGFTDSANTGGVNLAPGTGDNISGTGSYSGSADLVAGGLDFNVGPDGILRAEYFEAFNDFVDAPEGLWVEGTLTVTYVPAPGAFALLGLGGLACVRRRRR